MTITIGLWLAVAILLIMGLGIAIGLLGAEMIRHADLTTEDRK